jgi:hypothetical protein
MNRSMNGIVAMIIAACAYSFVTGAASANTIKVYSLGGSQPGIGHDPDKPAPLVTSQGFYATGPTGQYQSVRFTADALGLAGLTLGQITSIAYDHQQDGGGIDWQMKVYTESQAAGQWYGNRLNYDLSANPDSGWSTYTDTNGTAERIKPFGVADIYRVNNPSGFSSAVAAASHQKVLFFDISAGANSGGFPFNTYLNNITVNSTLGSATLQAAVVPLPAALPAGIAIMGLLAVKRRFGGRAKA